MENQSNSVPSARLQLDRIIAGVTGHRTDLLASANESDLRHAVQRTLTNLKEASVRQPVVISSLAEGADQMVAEVGLELGFDLWCPLPFPQDAYERDFTDPKVLAKFRNLLGRASTVEEILGSRGSVEFDHLAYARAGDRILEQANVLLAIWDGEAARGVGGTGDVVRVARHRGIPIVWITASAPHRAILLNGESDGDHEVLSVIRSATQGIL
jgi:hypothetical protein